MGIFGGGSDSGSQSWPTYTGVQLNVAVNTMPIPILWGAGKLGTNLIEYVDFSGHKVSQGGKGGGKGDSTDYTATLELALCEGLVDSVPLVLVNTNQQETLSQLKMTLIPGTYPEQEPWSYMMSAHPGNAYGYPGTAIIAVENYDLGESASVPNQNMLVVRQCLTTQGDNYFAASWCKPDAIQRSTYPIVSAAFPSVSGIPTADMALVIQDMLTNAQYGVPCFPAGSIDTATLLSGPNAASTGDMALQTYLRALGIGMSPVLDSQETAQSILDRWMQITNCAAVWGTTPSGCALKFVPYGDETISGNGVVYVPNLAAIYDLDDDDYLGDSSQDPVQVTRTDFNDAYNVVRVEVTSADGFFAYLPVEARDQNAIELAGGPRIMPTVTAHEIVGVEVGAIVSQLILQQGLYWRNTATFKLDETMCLLEPMDMVTLTDANLGLNRTPYRILSIEEDDNSELTVTAQEFRQGVSSAVAYLKQVSVSGVPNPSAAASSVNTPVIFEPTSALVSQAQVWMAVCGGGGAFDPNWGGCQVWVSVDNDNYIQAGTIYGPSRMGVLTANLATYSGSQPDNTNTLYVDLSESEGVLSSGTSLSDAENGRTLCFVDGELISYVTATLVDATATNEHQTIPSTAPYNVVVDNTATFLSNGSVRGGLLYVTAFTEVSSNPTAGEYAIVEPGVYQFSGQDFVDTVEITYTYGSSYHYALTELERGMYGTTIAAHSSGAQFARLDSAIFEYDLPSSYVGVELYIKLVSFNVFGLGLEDISSVEAFVYAPSGAGLPGGIVKGGTYVATSADATAGALTIVTTLSVVAVAQVTIARSGVNVTADAAVTTPGADIDVANGATTYAIAAGDSIAWIAIGS